MTKCPSTKEFDAFLDADLSSQARNDFLEHIRSCEECRRELDERQHVDELIKQTHREIVPRAEWIADISAKLSAGSKSSDAKRVDMSYRIRNFAGFATAALLLIAATVTVWALRDGSNAELQPSDKVAQDLRPPEQLTNPGDQTVDDSPFASEEPAVLAQDGFLVGKHPDEEDEIEVYWVLPIQEKQ